MNLGGIMKAGVCLLIVLFLAGCRTLEGIGKDLQKGGEMIEKAAK
jgi:predicted small secreted protein